MERCHSRPRVAPTPPLRRRRPLLVALTVLSLALSGAVALAAEIQVIELQHRLAEEIAPSLAAVAGREMSIKAEGPRLIVRGSPSDIARLREVVRTLDVPARSLRISVRRIIGGNDTSESASIHTTRAAGADRSTQTVRAREGAPVFIDTGERVPITERFLLLEGDTTGVAGQRRLQHRPRGFYATAQVVDGRALVELSVSDSNGDAQGRLRQRRVVTTLSGGTGEWIPVAAVHETEAVKGEGIVYSTRDADTRRYRLQIRVEVLP